MSAAAALAILLTLGGLHVLGAWAATRQHGAAGADIYFATAEPLDVVRGVAGVLGFWVTANTILAAPELTFRLGVAGMLDYSILGAVALIVFSPVARRLVRYFPGVSTNAEFFRLRFGWTNYVVFLVIYLFYMVGLLVTQGNAVGLFMEQMAGVPYAIGVLVTFTIGTVYATVGGLRGVVSLALYQVALIIAAVLVVPTLTYLQVSVKDVYHGLLVHQAEALNLARRDGLAILLGGSLMAVGEVMIDNVFWQRVRAVRPERVGLVFGLAGAAWFFIPLAISTLALVGLQQGTKPANLNLVAPVIAREHAGAMGVSLMLVSVLLAALSTIASELNGCTQVLLQALSAGGRFGSPGPVQARGVTLAVGLAAAVLSLLFLGSMMDSLLFLGVVNAAYITPLVAGLWLPTLGGGAVMAAVLGAIGTGYWAYVTRGPAAGIVLSFGMSTLVCAVAAVYGWLRARVSAVDTAD